MDIKRESLNFDYFMALSNIIKELQFMGQFDPVEVWREYCRNIKISEKQKYDPNSYTGFEKFKGFRLEQLKELYKIGGIALAFFHYGAYRHTMIVIIEALKEIKPSKTILLVVDKESYKSESMLKEWMKIYRKYNIKMVIAEEASIVIKLIRHLKTGGVILMYLDGLTGSGIDKNPITVPLVSSNINIRSGFFRMLKKSKIPLVGAIESSKKIISISYPLDTSDVTQAATFLMSFFRHPLMKDPSQWRLWYRHHQFATHTPKIVSQNTSEGHIKWICEEFNNTLGLEEVTGNVYELMES